MTDQELFDRVARHLLYQGRTSTDGDHSCRYRGADGTSCAIGCLIPDEKYDPEFEGVSLRTEDLAIIWEILEAAGVAPEQRDLAVELQVIHDCYKPKNWRGRLEKVIRLYELDSTVLDGLTLTLHPEGEE